MLARQHAKPLRAASHTQIRIPIDMQTPARSKGGHQESPSESVGGGTVRAKPSGEGTPYRDGTPVGRTHSEKDNVAWRESIAKQVESIHERLDSARKMRARSRSPLGEEQSPGRLPSDRGCVSGVRSPVPPSGARSGGTPSRVTSAGSQGAKSPVQTSSRKQSARSARSPARSASGARSQALK